MLETIVLQISKQIQTLEEWLLSASVLGIALLAICNVVARSVFDHSLAFAEELSQFLIIIVCFVGLSYAASKGRHIRMTALYDQLSPRWRKVFMVAIAASTSALLFALGCYACRYVHTVYQLGSIYPVLRVPSWIVYLAAPVGLFLASIQYALAVVKNLTARDVYLSFERKDEYEEPVIQEI